MVALTILAVALAAGYRALGQSSNNAELLKRRALAQWVAQNQLAAMQLKQAPASSTTGQASMAGIDFIWRSTLTQTPNPTFRRMEIVVADRADPEYQLARLAAYLSLAQ
jgi:general secretion pathway protein I